MKPRQKKLVVLLGACVLVGVSYSIWRAKQKPSDAPVEKPAPPVSVAKIVKEDELNLLTLNEEAEKRIGLSLAEVKSKQVRRVRVYGGEVMVPSGRSIQVSAPLVGLLKTAGDSVKKPGEKVKAGEPLFHLLPLLTPDAKATLSAALADADGQVNNTKTQLELAKVALERAKRVLREGAGSQRQVDEAQATHDQASKTLDAAQGRRSALQQALGDMESGTSTPLAISAPQTGLLRTVSALAGQIVSAGANLFEVIDAAQVWVRVPTPVGDLESLVKNETAQVGALSAHPGAKTAAAQPIPAPPSANAQAATVDLFFELVNTEGTLTPGQRVGVSLPLTTTRESLTLPWSALVFDIHGNTWVYEQVAERKYARRRVTVHYTLENEAILMGGPPAGAKIVVAGVQELFGAETGFIK